MGGDVDFQGEFTVTQYLHFIVFRDQARSVQLFDPDLGRFLFGCKNLDHRKIDSLIFYFVDIGKTELGKTPLQRHLAPFETALAAVSRT